MITLYIVPGCDKCRAAMDMLRELGRDYEAVDLTQDIFARDYCAQKKMALPIIEVDGECLSLESFSRKVLVDSG